MATAIDMEGFDRSLAGWPIPWPLDLHHHCRNGAMAELVTPYAAQHFRYITAMPNLGHDRIRTPEQAVEYRNFLTEIGKKTNPKFKVNVPLYLEPDTSPSVVERGFDIRAWRTAKLYPRGGTTNSAEGVDFREVGKLYPVFNVMQRLGMLLLIHAEPTHDMDGVEIDVLEREQRSLTMINTLLQKFPQLRIVFEHMSSDAGVRKLQHWKSQGYNIEATVAPQYLFKVHNDLFRGGMNPGLFCIPVYKYEEDRQALIKYLVGGGGFLGTDSAPHPKGNKARLCGCSGGLFNAPVALPSYFHIFRMWGKAGWFQRFLNFACFNGPKFYGLDIDRTNALVIRADPWHVPPSYGEGANEIAPFMAGELCPYSIKPL